MTLLASEDFNGVTGRALQAHNPDWVKVRGANAAITSFGTLRGTGYSGHHYYYTGTEHEDISVSADIIFGSSQYAQPGVYARMAIDGAAVSGYLLQVYSPNSFVSILALSRLDDIRIDNFAPSENNSLVYFHLSANPFNGFETEFNIRLDVIGDVLTAYLDDVEVFSYHDNTYSSGLAGLYVRQYHGNNENLGATIDYWEARSLGSSQKPPSSPLFLPPF